MLALLIFSLIFLVFFIFVITVFLIDEFVDYTKVPKWVENTCEFIYKLFS